MGRKRKRAGRVGHVASAADRRGVWLQASEEELLAYLDSGVAFRDPQTKEEVQRNYEDVDEEIAQHLNTIAESDVGSESPETIQQFSATQIQHKLRRLWATYGKDDVCGKDWKIIYKMGSSCLTSSKDPGVACRIAHRSGAIKVIWFQNYVRSPRKTRAGSQIRQQSQLPPPVSRSASSASPARINQVVGRKTTGEYQLTRTISAGAYDAVQDIHRSRSATTDPESETSSQSTQRDISPQIKQEEPKIEIMIPPVAHSSSVRTLFLESSPQSTDQATEAYGTPSADFASFRNSHNNEDASAPGSRASSEPTNRAPTYEQEMNALKAEAALEIDFWKAKYRATADKSAELERVNNALVVKLGALTETGARLTVNDLLKSQAMIDELVEQIHSHRSVQALKRRVTLGDEIRTTSNVSKLMQGIRFRLQNLLREGKFVSNPMLSELSQEHPLRALVEEAFDVCWGGNDAVKLLERYCCCADMQQCSIFALSGVALAQWVFRRSQADLIFDRYQDNSTRGSSNRYRLAMDILAVDDPALAKAIDIEVHTRIANEDSFEYFRRNKARKLANQLQDALAPVWTGDPVEGGSPEADSDDGNDVTDQLTEVFDLALTVQCRLVLTGQQYDCVWYAPGESFDEARMTPYVIKGAEDANTPVISLTMLPGVSRVTHTKVGIDFGGFTSRRQWLGEDSAWVVEPLVWRGCAAPH